MGHRLLFGLVFCHNQTQRKWGDEGKTQRNSLLMIHKVGKHTRQGNTWLKYYKLNKVNSYHTGGTALTKWELNGNRKTKYGHTQGKTRSRGAWDRKTQHKIGHRSDSNNGVWFIFFRVALHLYTSLLRRTECRWLKYWSSTMQTQTSRPK